MPSGQQENDLSIFNITNAIPIGILVLNKDRRIVFANKHITKVFIIEDEASLLNKLPGEAVNCMYALGSEACCGTTEYCRTCGAFKAISKSQNLESATEEFRVLQDINDNALDFRVWTVPYKINNELYTVFTLQDIQDEKRREIFERVFFHDILNSAGGLRGIAELFKDALPEEIKKYIHLITSLTDRLIDEIKAQREIISAEKNELNVETSWFNSHKILQGLIYYYSQHELSKGKTIKLSDDSENVKIETSRVLLWRILSNMLKNALEASGKEDVIKIGCKQKSGYLEFSVNNPAVIEKEIQLQIFQRSFSTKGKGRGLGTYSIKLLTEQYLHGKVWLESNESDGTTFFISIPIVLKNHLNSH